MFCKISRFEFKHDFTLILIHEGFMGYICAIKEAFERYIIPHSIRKNKRVYSNMHCILIMIRKSNYTFIITNKARNNTH